jgi:hypothetical protein
LDNHWIALARRFGRPGYRRCAPGQEAKAGKAKKICCRGRNPALHVVNSSAAVDSRLERRNRAFSAGKSMLTSARAETCRARAWPINP